MECKKGFGEQRHSERHTRNGSRRSSGTPSERSLSEAAEQFREALKYSTDGFSLVPVSVIFPLAFTVLNRIGQAAVMCTRSSDGIPGFIEGEQRGFIPTAGEKRLAELGWTPIGRVWVPPTT